MNNIELEKNSYDPFIDYMKGMCILSVIILHTITFSGWVYILQAVPLFLLIQVFHSYKHGLSECKPFSIKKIWKRIFWPFFIAQMVIFVPVVLHSSKPVLEILKSFAVGGGNGPGSYYPWVYLQFAIILPFIAYLLKGKSLLFRGG